MKLLRQIEAKLSKILQNSELYHQNCLLREDRIKFLLDERKREIMSTPYKIVFVVQRCEFKNVRRILKKFCVFIRQSLSCARFEDFIKTEKLENKS